MEEPQDWRDFALCRGMDSSIFYPDKGYAVEGAKRICAECPVRTACLDDALRRREDFGVWGGTSERERRRIMRHRRRLGS